MHLQNLAADDDGGHAAAATGAGSTQAADKAGLLEYIRERWGMKKEERKKPREGVWRGGMVGGGS